MGKTKEYAQDFRLNVSMPVEVYKKIKNEDKVTLLGGYDAGMYDTYKRDAEWQEAEYFYKLMREKKKQIESKIEFKHLENK